MIFKFLLVNLSFKQDSSDNCAYTVVNAVTYDNYCYTLAIDFNKYHHIKLTGSGKLAIHLLAKYANNTNVKISLLEFD